MALRLVTLPLWGLGAHRGLSFGTDSQLGGQLGEHGLVGGHASSQSSEVAELVGETDRVPVEEHEVAGLALTLSTWRTPLPIMDSSSLSRRYLPRPIGQRLRTCLADIVNSLTRPLILATALGTFMVLPEKISVRWEEPKPVPPM